VFNIREYIKKGNKNQQIKPKLGVNVYNFHMFPFREQDKWRSIEDVGKEN
jgi:hypothetical protein